MTDRYLTNGTCPDCTRAMECLESDHSIKRHRDTGTTKCPVVEWKPAGHCGSCDALIETAPGAFSYDGPIYRHVIGAGVTHRAHPIPRCPSGHRTHCRNTNWGIITECENGEYESYYSLGD
jgi:hypothetical protein